MKGMDKSSSEGPSYGGLPSDCTRTGFRLRFPGTERRVAICDCGILVGRSKGCDVVLSDEDASRRHTSFRILGGCVWVSDEGSTNGTLVNGELVERKRIGVGDEVLVGNVRLRLEEGDGDLPESLAEDWERFLAALGGRPIGALEALRVLASAEDCRMDPDGVVAINWAEGERGIDGLGPVRARLVEEALGILAGVQSAPG